MLTYNKIRKYDSDVFALKFPQDKYRIDLSFGDYGNFVDFEKLERVSDIYGEAMLDEVVAGRINFGFFQPKKDGQNISEHIGGAWDGDVGWRNYVSDNDFPDAIYTFDGQLIFDDIRTAEQAAHYDSISAWNGAVSYILVKDGEVYNEVPKSMTSIYNNLNPRTLAGQDAEGAFYFVAVDGRSSESKGFTGLHSAALMKELGCVGAFNGDGGGSTIIMLYDDILNKPSDGSERYVGTILLAYEKYDPKDLPLIKMGNKGVFTHLLQRLLGHINNDYSGVDGIFGTQTFEKVKAFQTRCGLIADGIVGAKTWDALYRVAVKGETITPPPPTPKPEPTPERKIKICIDPGHGGSDRHNVGNVYGYVEPDGVLKISKYLRDELLSTGKFDVLLTRETDNSVINGIDISDNLRERSRIASRWGADMFISQHTNANGDLNVRGSYVYYSLRLSENRAFANKLGQSIADYFKVKHFGAMTRESTRVPGADYLAVIDESYNLGIKEIYLIESLFHSNKSDELILSDDENLKSIAKIQAKCICEKYGVEYTLDIPDFGESNTVEELHITKIYKTVEIIASQLNVRALPSTFGNIIGTYANSEFVEVYGESNGWYQVIFNNSIGYISVVYTKDVPVDTTDYQALYEDIKAKHDLLQAEYNQLQDAYDLLLVDKEEPKEESDNKLIALLEAIIAWLKK